LIFLSNESVSGNPSVPEKPISIGIAKAISGCSSNLSKDASQNI